MRKTREDVLQTEFSKEFVAHMENAMVMSFYKYGALADAYPERVDAVGSLRDRLREYAKTGNTEFLVDVANFAMIEFLHPRHPEAHFRPTSDEESTGRRAVANGLLDKRDNLTVGENPLRRDLGDML